MLESEATTVALRPVSSGAGAAVCFPTTTTELLRRLQDPTISNKERGALNALVLQMADIFNTDKTYVHIHEAAAIVPYLDWDGYSRLLQTFMDAIIAGTADGSILRPELCEEFVCVLRYADSIGDGVAGAAPGQRRMDLQLENVMISLQTRLQRSVDGAGLSAQYQTLLVLGNVLDAMNDAKTNGISREKYREPLLKTLKKLKDSNEIRIAQAAAYAFEALRGIPDDEGPYKTLLRHGMTFVQASAQIAGAVPTMDPSKLVDGLVQLADIPDLVESLVEVVKAISRAVDAAEGAVQDVRFYQQSKPWYNALRFTDILIRAQRFAELESFIGAVACRKEGNFICGIYSQLERAYQTNGRHRNDDTEARQEGIRSTMSLLNKFGRFQSNDDYIKAWRTATSEMCGIVDTVANAARGSARERMKMKFSTTLKKPKTYSSKVACSAPGKTRLSSALYESAWTACREAHVSYADLVLRNCYLDEEEKRLKIIRISGDELPMEQCYINLTVVQRDRTLGTRRGPASGYDDDAEDALISLQDLFAPRKCADGMVRTPRRVLIRGRAGVGKTTLCKKIVHEFTRRPISAGFATWTQRFDRILWLPLRSLKLHEARLDYSLAELLKEGFFRQLKGSEVFSEGLGRYCAEGEGNNRTLFLLDGFDEVSDLLDADHKMSRFLRWLLRQPNAIITSRPGGKHMDSLVNLDCELETTGFQTHQVQAYMRKVLTDSKQQVSMQNFINGRPLVAGLVRIPIQLDALCYVWANESVTAYDGDTQNDDLSTMTSVYQKVERWLWCKDLPRLYKEKHANFTTADTALDLADSEVNGRVRTHATILQTLAFAGLYHDKINFDFNWCTRVAESAKVGPLSINLADFLGAASFLRSSELSSTHGNAVSARHAANRTYYFIHLTYQEYFAAHYFASCWTRSTPLLCPGIGHRPIVRVDVRDFVRAHKYQTRFRVFWCFVSGILGRDEDESHLSRFFNELEQEPRDIAGRAHQRLVIQCLAEADPLQNRSLFDQHRRVLHDWVIWTAKHGGDDYDIANEQDFPARVYESATRELSEDCLTTYMARPRPFLSTMRICNVAGHVANNTPHSTQALKILADEYTIPLNVLHTLFPHLKDAYMVPETEAGPKYICKGPDIFYTPSKHTGLPLMVDERHKVTWQRRVVAKLIASNLPDAIDYFMHFFSVYDHVDTPQSRDEAGFARFFNRFFSAKSSAKLGWSFSTTDIDRLVRYIDHANAQVRDAAMRVLFTQSPPPAPAMASMEKRLQGPDGQIVNLTLQDIPAISSELQLLVAQCLKSPASDTRYHAILTMAHFDGSLSMSDTAALLSALQSTTHQQRLDITRSLASAGYTAHITMVKVLIRDKSWDVRLGAVKVLHYQRPCGDVFTLLSDVIRTDPVMIVRLRAIQACLFHGLPTPSTTADILLGALGEDNGQLRETAAELMWRIDTTDNYIIRAIRLDGISGATWGSAMWGHTPSTLSLAVLDALFEKYWTCERYDPFRSSLRLILVPMADKISEEQLRDLFVEWRDTLGACETDRSTFSLLRDGSDQRTVSEISNILSSRANLPKDIQKALVDLVLDGSKYKSSAAADALSNPHLIDPGVVSALVEKKFAWIAARKTGLDDNTVRQVRHGLMDEALQLSKSRTYKPQDVFRHSRVLSDDDYSKLVGYNMTNLDFFMEEFLQGERIDATIVADGNDHYIADLAEGPRRITRKYLSISIEEYMGREGMPKALDRI